MLSWAKNEANTVYHYFNFHFFVFEELFSKLFEFWITLAELQLDSCYLICLELSQQIKDNKDMILTFCKNGNIVLTMTTDDAYNVVEQYTVTYFILYKKGSYKTSKKLCLPQFFCPGVYRAIMTSPPCDPCHRACLAHTHTLSQLFLWASLSSSHTLCQSAQERGTCDELTLFLNLLVLRAGLERIHTTVSISFPPLGQASRFHSFQISPSLHPCLHTSREDSGIALGSFCSRISALVWPLSLMLFWHLK